MSNNIPIFTIENFAFAYPLTQRNIKIKGKIDIYKGERVLIKGPSGSGKSTLLLALSGIIPSEIAGKLNGEITFKGKKIKSYPLEELHKNIGIVFQNPYSQRVTSTVEDELVFYLENLEYNPEEIEIRLKKLHKTLKLSSFMYKSSKKLSGGELQKIILASILIAEPEVLLFDEPTSYLDVKSEISFYRYLKENLNSQTVIIVDHKLNHNMNFIKRVIELDSEGNILFDGSKEKYKKLRIKNKVHREKIKWISNDFTLLQNEKTKKRLRLKIENVNFSYERGNPILKNINISIESGNVTSIFGLNGSGKTTLIKLAARLIKPNCTGSITLIDSNGKKISKKRHFYDSIGIVFQNPDTHFLFQTVGKEITNGKNINRTDKLAKAFNITDNVLQNPFTLSEGQKRRLNLANIFYLKKDIILLDEPTFGQDENSILNLIETINTLKENGIGFMIVSHDKEFIKSVSDNVYYLRNKRLKKLKTIKKISEKNNENN